MAFLTKTVYARKMFNDPSIIYERYYSWGEGGSISILNKESYHYALSRERSQVAWGLHGTCVMYLGPIDGKMMSYNTDINLKCHSQLLTSFHLTLNYLLILTHATNPFTLKTILFCDWVQ